MNEKIGIFGYGEVGQALAKFYHKPLIKDLIRDDGLENLDVLHVAIPFEEQNKFCEIIAGVMDSTNANLTIIHSTVLPGTTRMIGEMTERMIAHSPIRGIHPKLYEGLREFDKCVAAPTNRALGHAVMHLHSAGFAVKVMETPETTELAKLMDTTYYGVCIAWSGEMKKYCEKVGVSYNEASTIWNESYNEGYTNLGHPHFVRPVLYPPDNYIGGHCILPNAELLKQVGKSKALDLIEEYK
jgi:UDP-N-acetyl-D-mannosaminuronate dehydrogenase